ncbi:MAG: prepilin-type N-terminal cleavage/methylation domain-containing protein [bacterium]
MKKIQIKYKRDWMCSAYVRDLKIQRFKKGEQACLPEPKARVGFADTPKGFTLVEIMLSLAILAGVIAGLSYMYGSMVFLSSSERKKAELNTDIGISLNLLERDIMMAGFGTSDKTRVASFEGGTNSDRLFLADAWEIVRDFTDNGYDDGIISEDSYGIISTTEGDEEKEGGGGYFARLADNAGTESEFIIINNLDIDPDALHHDDDFKEDNALIIHSGLARPPQGHRITTIIQDVNLGWRVNLLDRLREEYNMNNVPTVVPAICYHIGVDADKRSWLYRNNERVLPDVENLSVEYGYDVSGNRILENNEWFASLFNIPNYEPRFLEAVRVSLGIRMPTLEEGREKIGTYTVSVELRN